MAGRVAERRSRRSLGRGMAGAGFRRTGARPARPIPKALSQWVSRASHRRLGSQQTIGPDLDPGAETVADIGEPSP